MKRDRSIVRAVLAVGEGKAEIAVLEHVKALYVVRGGGLTLKIQGGYGKGGKGVIDYALGQLRNADFDACIALLDTDVDWDAEQHRRAQDSRIEVVESSPCLEAWLLAIHGRDAERGSAAHKDEFKRCFGGPAHDRKLLARHFERLVLDRARTKIAPLDRLLHLLGE